MLGVAIAHQRVVLCVEHQGWSRYRIRGNGLPPDHLSVVDGAEITLRHRVHGFEHLPRESRLGRTEAGIRARRYAHEVESRGLHQARHEPIGVVGSLDEVNDANIEFWLV